MAKIRCEYCHMWIDEHLLTAHVQEHLHLRPDGQQNEYVTLPPEEWHQGSLEDVPKVYRHLRCGSCTGMPDEIIRTYLKAPFAYTADLTFCSGCRTHVPCRELVWVETGENMQAYNDRLRGVRLRKNGMSGDLAKAVTLISRLVIYALVAGLIVVAVIGLLWVRAGNEP